MSTLDQHADTLEGDTKPPLVLVGNEGSGKSALLANWVAKRREHKHRDEFLFQHFVGCTTQSLQLSHTLSRLETALKDFFQLREMKVPDTEEDLRWSLHRFLQAAAKKHSPARIVIIIDGIHRLKSDSTADGMLYWLPTELPPCVRFILSTVEFERSFRGKRENEPHCTFVELQRRQCPMLRIEPLGVSTRHSVIDEFKKVLAGGLEISEAQQFKIETNASSAQPMYLRSLLQALRLSTTLTNLNSDDLLDRFLACSTAHELVDSCLNVCCEHQAALSQLGTASEFSVEFNRSGLGGSVSHTSSSLSRLLGVMLSVVYVSRSGLTEAEIWGLMKMQGQVCSEEEQTKLLSILQDLTMDVDEMYSFSHEIYREVVYRKYIVSRDGLVGLHKTLARFFGQLPPCDRKLVALPFHLEMAGLWSQVKNCLTEIEMFQLWWTPKFKSDFMKFWVSLTSFATAESVKPGASPSPAHRRNNSNMDRDSSNSGANNSDPGAPTGLPSRPTYDIVEEYVKSLDEYRQLKHPSDEAVAGIILEIGDFLLEFATSGYEKDADVPVSVHPRVPFEDLAAMGVPFITRDKLGRTALFYPKILHTVCNKNKLEDGQAADAPTKAIEDVPVCSAYYYNRWMWIQFPYVALGNCEARFGDGVAQKVAEGDAVEYSKALRSASANKSQRIMPQLLTRNNSATNINGTSSLAGSFSADSFKLPAIKFNRKAAKSFPRVVKAPDVTDAPEVSSKVMQRVLALQDSVQNYREEFDFLVQMKSILSRRGQELRDQLVDLQRTAESCTQFDSALQQAIQREAEANTKFDAARSLNKNLQALVTMCDRHPANVPALITELGNMLEQDAFLLKEIKKRLWEQRFEHQAHVTNFRLVKQLVAEAVSMYSQLAVHRQDAAKDLVRRVKEDERALTLGKLGSKSGQENSRRGSNLVEGGEEKARLKDQDDEASLAHRARSWEQTWGMITTRTGVSDPEAFLQRMSNSSTLQEQIKSLCKASEQRLETLKKELSSVEAELEVVRYEASFAGVQSSKEHKKKLAEKQQKLRQKREKAEAVEQLEQRVVAGLAHISDILFIPKSEEDAPVSNLVRDIEAVLDTLINEREKQLQQQQGGATGSGGSGAAPIGSVNSAINIAETHANRSPELDFVIAKHESPTVRQPRHLPSKSDKTDEVTRPWHPLLRAQPPKSLSEEDDAEEEGPWDRGFAKTQTAKFLHEVRKSTRTRPGNPAASTSKRDEGKDLAASNNNNLASTI